MTTQFVDSSDGQRIAFDVQGSGPPLLLLHGGLQNRAVWQSHRDRLAHDYRTIAMDLRGHGESAMPADSAAYEIDRLCDDVLRVASHCGADRFDLWGYSYGANIGRYLAVRSARIRKFVMTGVHFGRAATGVFRDVIVRLVDYWTPIVAAKRAGNLKSYQLSATESAQLESGQAEALLAWMSALLDWPEVEPEQLRCPTLWLVGSRNPPAMTDVAARGPLPRGSLVRLHILQDLDHAQEIEAVDLTVPLVRSFFGESRAAPVT